MAPDEGPPHPAAPAMDPSSPLNGRNFRNAFVLLLTAAISLLVLAISWSFLKPLLLGVTLAGLSHPLYRRLRR